jgi:putative Mg2+ transporter-C (MgtC) family protein
LDWQAFFDPNLINEAIVKIAMAGLLGGLVGIEREIHGQAAGVRTYILVAVGSCLIMMVSLNLESMYHAMDADSAVRIDPGRIASYALAGMGFLGAGAIISGRGSVRGLTTAAGMWMITAVGLAVGSGFFIPAIFTTFLCLVILFSMRYTKQFFRRDIYSVIRLVSDDVGGQLTRIERVMEKYPLTKVQYVSFRRMMDRRVIIFRISVMHKEDLEWRDITRELTKLPGVRRIALDEGKVP